MELIKNPCMAVTVMKTSTTEMKAIIMTRRTNDSTNSGGEGHSTNDVILAFIDDEEEVRRPATTRSGRSITRGSKIDFSFF